MLSAATGRDGYDARPDLDEAGWKTLLTNLDRLTGLAAARGVRAVLHPHVGTMVERGDEFGGCSRARPSRSAWTPATCSSAAPTRPS